MKKYAKVINEETKLCEVGLGTNSAFYQSIGMTEMEVEQAYNGQWYLKGYAPAKPEPTIKEQVAQMEAETGLTRVMREMILAENSGASEYVKAKAQEIEALATELRKQFFGGRDKTPPFSIDKIEKINYN